jgi:hypothetical protein
LRGNALPSVGGFDEELIDPGAFAAIFQAEVEAEDQVGDGSVGIAREVNKTVGGVLHQFQ